MDDVLGVDENKTFGISNKTLLGKNLSKITPGGKNNIWEQTGDFFEDKVTAPLSNRFNGDDAEAAAQAQLDAYNSQVSALEAKENEANRMGLASTLLSRGKGKFFDITRPEEVEKFLIEQEGKYLDPFPDYLRQAGDRLLGDLENTGENINNYIGSADDRMRNFQPTLERLGGINQNAIDQLSSIYDGRMESELGGFKDRAQDITRQLQGLNTQAGDITAGLQGNVLDEAERYANSLGRSVDMETALANARYDQMDMIPEYMRGTADQLLNAERAKARIAGANAENTANAGQRGLRSAMVGQGNGTGTNMANAMIRAQLGQDRSDLLADALLNNIQRRGDADVRGAEIGADRFERLGEINPAMADVYRNEAMLGRANTELGFGDPRLQARAENLGLDQSMVDSDQSFFSSILSQQLANTGMIPGLGMQEAMLPALMGEAALSGQGPLARSVSPYTSTGTLPQGQTVFQNTPYTPPAEGGRRDFLDILSDVPGYIEKGKEAYGKIKGILD